MAPRLGICSPERWKPTGPPLLSVHAPQKARGMSHSRTTQSLSLHDLLDTLLTNQMATEESHWQEERRRFEPSDGFLEDCIEKLSSKLQRFSFSEQGIKTLIEGPTNAAIRKMAYLDMYEWAKENCTGGERGLTWELTPWEYAVPILISDHDLSTVEDPLGVDDAFGRLRRFLLLRRLLHRGEPEPQDHGECLTDLADVAAKVKELNRPDVVRELLLKLWPKFPTECRAMAFPKRTELGSDKSDGELQRGKSPRKPKHPNSDSEELTGEAKALALLVQHPEWSNVKIAKEVPCSRTTLYTWQKFVAAREALSQGRRQMPRGTKDDDHNLEAWK